MMPLTEKCVVMVRKLLPRLASNHDGEVVATARAIERTLKSCGCSYHELSKAISITARPEPRQNDQGDFNIHSMMVREACEELLHGDTMTEWEEDFIMSIKNRTHSPLFRMTEKQFSCLIRICNKYGVEL